MDADAFDATYKPKNVIAEFQNALGETRIIHRPKGRTIAALRILKQSDTVVDRLNRAAAVLTGERIRAERIAKGIGLGELAERAGLKGNPSKVYMFSIERAARRQGIRFGTLYALAIALGCPISALMPTPDEVQRAAKVGFQEVTALK